MTDTTVAGSSEKRLTAPELHAKRVADSLAFHRDRIDWLSDEPQRWDDGTPVEKADARTLLNQSKEAVRLLEQGLFVAGGDA